jgi:hypothetical protein
MIEYQSCLVVVGWQVATYDSGELKKATVCLPCRTRLVLEVETVFACGSESEARLVINVPIRLRDKFKDCHNLVWENPRLLARERGNRFAPSLEPKEESAAA